MVNSGGVFRRTAVAGVVKLKSLFSKLLIGTNENEIYQNATGKFVIKNNGTGKETYLLSEGAISIKTTTNVPVRIFANNALIADIYSSLFYINKSITMNANSKIEFSNADNTKKGHIYNSGGAGAEGPIDFFDSSTTSLKTMSLILGKIAHRDLYPFIDNTYDLGATAYRLKDGWINNGYFQEITEEGPNGSLEHLTHDDTEVTIPAGSGSGGIDTVVIIPAGAYVKRVIGRVTQAPGGGATKFQVCVKGDGNSSLGLDIPVAVNTVFDHVKDGDGNRSDPWGQILAVEITVTTDNDVTGADMKIRIADFYEEFEQMTS